jgi:hypothetical protein
MRLYRFSPTAIIRTAENALRIIALRWADKTKRKIRIVALAVTVTVPWALALAEQDIPAPEAPVPRVTVHKKGNEVVVTWTDGRPPFFVVREAPQANGAKSTLSYPAENLAARTFTDRSVPDGVRYWYRVFDSKAKPEIFAISGPEVSGPRDLVLITGVGFSGNCQDIHIDQGGDPWRPYECSFTEIRLRVPADFVNGPLVLTSPTGTAFGFKSGWRREKATTW